MATLTRARVVLALTAAAVVSVTTAACTSSNGPTSSTSSSSSSSSSTIGPSAIVTTPGGSSSTTPGPTSASVSVVVPTVAPPAPTAGSAAGSAQAAATRWAQAWCGWDYRRPYLARERGAQALMTPAGAKDLEVTPAGEWQTQVVATHQVSVCSGLSVHFAEGGGNARLAYVRMAATRTVTDDNGVTQSPFLDQRRVVLEHGHWLVDQRVQGG